MSSFFHSVWNASDGKSWPYSMLNSLVFLIFLILPTEILGYVGEENWIAIFNGHPYHPNLRLGAHTVDHPFYPGRFYPEHPKHFGNYLNDAFLAYWLEHNPHYEVFGQTFENEQKQICAKFPAQNGYDQMIKCSGFRVLINTRPVHDKRDSDFFLRPLPNSAQNIQLPPRQDINWPQAESLEYRPVVFDPKIQILNESIQAGSQAQAQIGREPERQLQESERSSQRAQKIGHYYKDEAGQWQWHEGNDGRLGHWYRDQGGWHWHNAYGQEITINTKRRRRHRAHPSKPNTIARLSRQIGRGAQYGQEEVEYFNQKAILIVDPQRHHSFFGTARPIYKGSQDLEAVGVNYDGKVIVVPLSGQNAYQGYQVFQIIRGRET